ncbi:MAG TPA: hypothetical protein VFA75_07060 [Nevskia sp.]|jgi:3D (Asp-Asp-Asp) domain-containing protein|nr:hypothetical protein [Nevskia sp.]
MNHTSMKVLAALAIAGAVAVAGADSTAAPDGGAVAAGDSIAAGGARQAGSIADAAGTVQIQRGGQPQNAAAGSAVAAGDVVRVGDKANAQLRMADNAMFVLGSGTDFRIADYSYNGSGSLGEARPPASARYQLDRGVLRTVTGTLGKQSGDTYLMVAPEADVKPHGTDFALQVGNGLLVIVYNGSVTVSNDTGGIIVNAGQFIFVASRKSPLRVGDVSMDVKVPIILNLPPLPGSASPS